MDTTDFIQFLTRIQAQTDPIFTERKSLNSVDVPC
jgi:hypothetical protein